MCIKDITVKTTHVFRYLLTRHPEATASYSYKVKTASKHQKEIFGEKPQRRATACQTWHHSAQLSTYNAFL